MKPFRIGVLLDGLEVRDHVQELLKWARQLRCGRSIAHIGAVVEEPNCTAGALGRMVFFQQNGLGGFFNFPDRDRLERPLERDPALEEPS